MQHDGIASCIMLALRGCLTHYLHAFDPCKLWKRGCAKGCGKQKSTCCYLLVVLIFAAGWFQHTWKRCNVAMFVIHSVRYYFALPGHCATIHAATIGDNSLVGMGATVLDGAKVGPWESHADHTGITWESYGSACAQQYLWGPSGAGFQTFRSCGAGLV